LVNRFPTHPGIHVDPLPVALYMTGNTQSFEYHIKFNAEAATMVCDLWNACAGRFRKFLFKHPISGMTLWARFEGDKIQAHPLEAGEVNVLTLTDPVLETDLQP